MFGFTFKDLKRSLAVTLSTALLVSNMDLSVFANSINTPRIESNLRLAALYEENARIPIEVSSAVTIPLDFSGCEDDISSYGKDNISSIKFKSHDFEHNIYKGLVTSYLTLGYYELNLSLTFNNLFESYLLKNSVDSSDKDAVNNAALEFLSNDNEYTLEIEYTNGVVLEAEVEFIK